MFAWQLKPAPLVSPACATHAAPVWTAASPWASTTATCRRSRSSSWATSGRSASRAPISSSIPSSRGPPPGTGTDCVATAPRPAWSHGTTAPTENQCDCTATPRSSVSGSRATMEYVPMRRTEPIMTPRAETVLARVRAIPPGFVRAYGDLSPGAPRFAGAVLSSNDDPDLPWQRVVRADGSLPKGARQRALLEAEGVPFLGERVDMKIAHFPMTGPPDANRV